MFYRPWQRSVNMQVDFQAVGMGLHLIAPRSKATTVEGTAEDTAQMLAAYMDVQSTYGSRLGKDNASLCVKGLRVESQIVNPVEHEFSALATAHGNVQRKGAGLVQVVTSF